jgi:hypothetical protein
MRTKRLELLWSLAFTGVFVYLAFFTPASVRELAL